VVEKRLYNGELHNLYSPPNKLSLWSY